MGGLYDVAFAKTASNILACASADKFVYVWNWEKNKLVTKLGGHKDEVNGVTFHPSQQVMCTSSDDTQAIIWDFQEGIKLRTLADHQKDVYGASFLGAECEYSVATCCFDQKVRVYDMRDKKITETLQSHNDDIIGIDFSAQRRQLATGCDDGFICIWDTRTWGPPLFKINTRENPRATDNEVKRVKFNRDGTKLACGGSSQKVFI